MHAHYVVIGGGLSGLAAAIRLARYNDNVLLLEKHSRVGGLNSYYYRNNRLFETGLHAITNYADKAAKQAPLNKLLRQLKISRDEIGFHQQILSEINFPDRSLIFSNDFNILLEEISEKFSPESDNFRRLVHDLDRTDPFESHPYRSARAILEDYLDDPDLIDMLLCPILYYGSSWENDIDFKQFVIMFRSLYQEGLFRPAGTIKNLLDLLVDKLNHFGGTIKLGTGVRNIIATGEKIIGVTLENGEKILCKHLISTIGLDETRSLLGTRKEVPDDRRLSFVESIFQIDKRIRDRLPQDRTCIFYSKTRPFTFEQPSTIVGYDSGVISLPFNFRDLNPDDDFIEIRTTQLANYRKWLSISRDTGQYDAMKCDHTGESCRQIEPIIGSFADGITYSDCFTPLTVERFTGKHAGAIYGSPHKISDGIIGYDNLVIAGTDQGFLGIIGSMLSGVAMVNKHILSKL
ncbi:MAG: NAD(P)/FAD-dependent oxidoreductase [Desulfofustis sp.]|nr:NAD(P)/FAD-dependent oxidoreductase [Desulfofustis sp.]